MLCLCAYRYVRVCVCRYMCVYVQAGNLYAHVSYTLFFTWEFLFSPLFFSLTFGNCLGLPGVPFQIPGILRATTIELQLRLNKFPHTESHLEPLKDRYLNNRQTVSRPVYCSSNGQLHCCISLQVNCSCDKDREPTVTYYIEALRPDSVVLHNHSHILLKLPRDQKRRSLKEEQ